MIFVKLSSNPLFVAAQEIYPPSIYDAWLNRLSHSQNARKWKLGESLEGRDIQALTITKKDQPNREKVILIGRQHPPEITGTLAMLPFVETLLSNTSLAQEYRAGFETIVVPMLNPDGVVKGHWRHNAGGVDLNRDWGPFTQPETKLMNGLLQRIKNHPQQKLRFFLDFHSTKRDVFYTIPDKYPTDPPLFIRDWLENFRELMPNFRVKRGAQHDSEKPISKAHVYETYGAPAVTFEVGDNTDRQLIRKIGKLAAIAMMETLLATNRP